MKSIQFWFFLVFEDNTCRFLDLKDDTESGLESRITHDLKSQSQQSYVLRAYSFGSSVSGAGDVTLEIRKVPSSE